MSDRAACALCLAVLAMLALAVGAMGVFEDQIDQFLIGWAKSGANPVQSFLGAIIWVLALIGLGPTIFVPPQVFLGLAVLLTVAAAYFYITHAR